MIFDGKAFAKKIEDSVEGKVFGMAVKPKIVSILVVNDPASELYTKLKKSAAERVGIEFEVIRFESGISNEELGNKIGEQGARGDVTGLMVQLPLPGVSRKDTEEVLKAIPLSKDVDGLRWEESGVMPATVRAIFSILEKIEEMRNQKLGISIWKKKFVVVGARGAVGKPLTHFLRERKVEVAEVEWDTLEPTRRVLVGEVVISCVGKVGTVTGEMVRDGVIAIDVGMSNVEGKVVGDMTNEVYQKASVAVSVPGGVGPVTVASLMSNAIELV